MSTSRKTPCISLSLCIAPKVTGLQFINLNLHLKWPKKWNISYFIVFFWKSPNLWRKLILDLKNNENELSPQGLPITCRRGRPQSSSKGRKLADILFADVSETDGTVSPQSAPHQKIRHAKNLCFQWSFVCATTAFLIRYHGTFFALLWLKISLPDNDSKLLQTSPLLCQITAVKIWANYLLA